MLTAAQFSIYQPVIDRMDPEFPEVGNFKHLPFKGWLRGDTEVPAFLDCRDAPSRALWGRPMIDDSIVPQLGITTGITTLDLYKALVKLTQDAGVSLPKHTHTSLYIGVRLKDDAYHSWYVFADKGWDSGSQKRFYDITGITPQKINDNVWLVHHKE